MSPIRLVWFLALCALSVGQLGCGKGVNERIIEVKPQPPAVERVRTLLERYAEGLPVGSELEQFPVFISDMRDSDGDNLPIVEKLFQDLQEDPDNSAVIAEEALKQLIVKETGS